jgi:hypothetical protein
MKIQINKQALEMIDRVDKINKQMSKKYGPYILEEIIPDIMKKFEIQHARLFKAIDLKDNEKIFKEATQTIKAWRRIDIMAREAMKTKPQLKDTWQVKHSSGHIIHVYKDSEPKIPGITLSLDELVKFVPAKVLELKKELGGTITQVKPKENNDDR